jgi:hypothetical protein
MAFSFAVKMIDGSDYRVTKLLARGDSNTKTAKSDKAGRGIVTRSLSLAPAKASGFNLCTSASAGCIKGCLYKSGYAKIHPRTIQPARIAKARFLRLHPQTFLDRLRSELSDADRYAAHKGVKMYIRLNVISDVQWEKEFPGLLESFPNIQFYDYTKHYNRMLTYLRGDLPTNLHLTYSWSGRNLTESLDVLARGGNVAVPFDVKYLGEKRRPLPETWYGFPIVDGDITDLRPLDPTGGNVVGLRAKGDAKKDKKSGFVMLVGYVEGKLVPMHPKADGTVTVAS